MFDFDFEVEPIVTFLVGKTLEQSLIELHEEYEKAATARRNEALQQRRNFERAEIQKMEAIEGRLLEERDRRFVQVGKR